MTRGGGGVATGAGMLVRREPSARSNDLRAGDIRGASVMTRCGGGVATGAGMLVRREPSARSNDLRAGDIRGASVMTRCRGGVATGAGMLVRREPSARSNDLRATNTPARHPWPASDWLGHHPLVPHASCLTLERVFTTRLPRAEHGDRVGREQFLGERPLLRVPGRHPVHHHAAQGDLGQGPLP